MSVIDILTRVDAICKKYDKYDMDKQNDSNVSGDDAFARLYGVIEADIEAALQEKNRASAVALNAEIRRTKAKLLEEVPKLQRLAFKKVRSDHSKQSQPTRHARCPIEVDNNQTSQML
ncbi:hypothetical protein RJ641_017443 [Dillenia turbinata]|uniref:Uncharacterized protein n=1 Tax=Dillenia turbinata TaxID=194707 RepID=A0AAN8YZN7_9MAGN